MRVSSSNKYTKHIECVDAKRNVWKVRWDFKENDGIYSYEEQTFNRKPSLNEIKDLIFGWYNQQIDKAILNGFTWKNMSVWLSSENQFNYKAAYDLAVQTSGLSLPVKFKFGTPENPEYYTFTSLADFSDFYVQAMSYINATLDKGWQEKDNINWNKYNG